MIHATALKRIKRTQERLSGYLLIQDIFSFSKKAFKVKYYTWTLWVPKKAVIRWYEGSEDRYAVARWAIDSAKAHPSASYEGTWDRMWTKPFDRPELI